MKLRRTFRRSLLHVFGVVDATHAAPSAVVLPDWKWPTSSRSPTEVKTAWPAAIAVRKFKAKKVNHRTVGEFLNDLAESLVYGIGAIGTHKIPALALNSILAVERRSASCG